MIRNHCSHLKVKFHKEFMISHNLIALSDHCISNYQFVLSEIRIIDKYDTREINICEPIFAVYIIINDQDKFIQEYIYNINSITRILKN